MEITEKSAELEENEQYDSSLPYDMYTPVQYMVEAVSEMASELYNMKYFERGRWWYGEWEGDRRKVITIDDPKGHLRNICWGWNYNYIPHSTSKGTFKYARTEKAFSIDAVDSYKTHTEYPALCYDNDNRYNERIRLSEHYALPRWTRSDVSPEDIRACLKTICRRNIPFIKEYFERTKTDREVIEDIDRFSYAYSDPFHYLLWGQNYIKAFILARNGDIEKAERILSGRQLSGGNEKVLAKLREVYESGRSGS